MRKSIRLLAALFLLAGLITGVFGVAGAEAPILPDPAGNIYLPAVDDGAVVHVQNLAAQAVEAQFAITYEYGSPATVLSGVVNGGSSWTFMPNASRAPAQSAPLRIVPQGSARVYQVGPSTGGKLDYTVPFAVTVDRKGVTSASAPAVPGGGNGSYTGISKMMLSDMTALDNSYWIYAPIINVNYGGWNSIVRVMNTQPWPSQFDIWFYNKMGNPVSAITNFQLSGVDSAGASVAIDPAYPPAGVPDGTYSAWIRMTANDSDFNGAAAVVDVFKSAFGSQVVSTYRATPWQNAAVNYADEATLQHLMTGDVANFAPLVFKAFNDWNAAIRVVNVSGSTHAKVKVTFRDGDGTAVATLVDDIDRQSFKDYPFRDLSVIPQNFVGSATVESQVYNPAGTSTGPEPVISVVAMTKWMAGDASDDFPRLSESYNTINWDQGSDLLGAPYVSKFANDGFSSGLSIMNMNRQPGTTDFGVSLFTAAGRIWDVDLTSSEFDVKMLDLRNISDDMIPHGFAGSAIIMAFDSTQLGGAYLGGVVTEVSFADANDGGKAYEMTPIPALLIPDFGGCIVGQVLSTGIGSVTAQVKAADFVPAVGVTVDAVAVEGGAPVDSVVTDATGNYKFPSVAPGVYMVSVNDLNLISDPDVKVGVDNGVCHTANIETIYGTDEAVKDVLVKDGQTGDAVSGVVVTATSDVDGSEVSCTTTVDGTCDLDIGPNNPMGGYSEETTSVPSGYGTDSTTFTVEDGDSLTNILTINLLHAVCGTVMGNEDGLLQAVTDATVVANTAMSNPFTGSDAVNSDGKYCIPVDADVDKITVSVDATTEFGPYLSGVLVFGVDDVNGIITKDIELVP